MLKLVIIGLKHETCNERYFIMDENRLDIFLQNNSCLVELLRSSKKGRIVFAFDRQINRLYKEYKNETDPKRKLDLCTEVLNLYDRTIIREIELFIHSTLMDIKVFLKQRGNRKTIDRSDHKKTDYYSVAVILKNEARYIKEFVLFHQVAGADRIYIYDNDSTDNLLDVLQPYIDSGLVIYRKWSGTGDVQTAAYRDAIRRTKNRTKWLAIVDADEFLFSPKGDMKEQLKQYETYPGVAVNWVVFGPNGHIKRPDGLVMDNYFTTPANFDIPINCHIKSIVQPKQVFCMHHTHYAWYRHGNYAVNEQLQTVDNRNSFSIGGGRAFTEHNHREIFRINHYKTRSMEDLEEKCRRGYIDGASPADYDDQLKPFMDNMVEDHVISPFAAAVKIFLRDSC